MNRPSRTRSDLPALLQRALDLAVDAKAQGPVVLHLTEVAGYTDWALLVSGRSDRHVGGITEAIMAGLKQEGLVPIGTDGLDENLWALLDYDDFLVHVFYHPVRRHYDLESMWNDAPRVELGLPADVMDVSSLENLTPPDPMPSFRGGSFGAFEGELGDDEAPAGDAGELAALPNDGDYDDVPDDADDADGDYDDDLDDEPDDLDADGNLVDAQAPDAPVEAEPAAPPRSRK